VTPRSARGTARAFQNGAETETACGGEDVEARERAKVWGGVAANSEPRSCSHPRHEGRNQQRKLTVHRAIDRLETKQEKDL
jgi:hypothetical protein